MIPNAQAEKGWTWVHMLYAQKSDYFTETESNLEHFSATASSSPTILERTFDHMRISSSATEAVSVEQPAELL